MTVNEETEDSTETPGKAALWATVILVLPHVVDPSRPRPTTAPRS